MAALSNTSNSPPQPPSSPVVAAAANATVNAAANASATLSPRSLSLTRTESPPWTQIVRGQDSESSIAPVSPPSECSPENNNCNVNLQDNFDNAGGSGGGGGGGKKVAWNKKQMNGPGESVGPGPVVMGPSEAWPALSESTSKASPKVVDSFKNLHDFGAVSSPQVTGTESSSSIASSVHLLSQSSSTSPKLTSSNINHNPMPTHGRPVRQKSMKRDGRSNLQANGIFPHQHSSSVESSHNHNPSSTKPTTTAGGSDSSGRDNIQNHGHRGSGSRNAAGDHHQSRNSFRRGSGGSHSREGSHQNYGGRRGDQDRGNHDWNHQRSFNGRDASMQPRVSPRGFRAPSVSAPFVHPAPMRPAFMNPMGVAEVPMFYFPAVPFGAPVPGPMFIHTAPDPQLNAKIVNQIDYYFSNENLIKDTYLRKNMDENGWVPVTLIANFKKVMQLTDSTQHILDVMQSSTVVEVQGDKIRKRDGWVRWIMPPVQFSSTSGSQSPKSPTIDTMLAHIQNVKLDENNIDQNHSMGQLDVNVATISRSIPKDLNIPSQVISSGASSSGC